jgi:hypothetical protein
LRFQFVAMPRLFRPSILLLLVPLTLSPGLYASSYFLTTELFHGRLGDTRYRIRLFQTAWQMRLFSPLLTVEGWTRAAEPEFSGQVFDGASLPPPDDDKPSPSPS